ncbi:MAG: hypothetical protein K2J90_15140 [Lachnospiraceae bacterium]|nr:hypothetical protein [Lachnospiraceae bacterium]
MWGLLPMIIMLIVVISIPLLILWLIKELSRKQALNNAQRLPVEVQRLLKEPAGYTEITMKDRLRHSLRIIIIGFTIYLIVFIMGIVKNFVSDLELDLKTYFLGSLVVLAFIIVFVLKDLFKVAPWTEVYRVKAIPCFRTVKNIYVCYYDFVKEELAVGELPDTSSITSINTSQEGIFDVLVIARKHHLKLIDIIK